MRRVFVALTLIAVQAGLSACSVLYDVQQNANLKACDQLLSWNDRSACIKQNSVSFDQYEKQRKEAIKQKSE